MIAEDRWGRRPLPNETDPLATPKLPIPLAETRFRDVLAYQYLHGIDGRLPVATDEAKTSDTEKEKSDKGDEKSARRDPAKVESPNGTDQSDYLSRLASDLVDGNAQRMRHHAGVTRPQIAAVGVLGSDVYDKLEILHALRKQLPCAVFFTNALDARLFHPAEQSAARNLIVVSSYGLSLHDQYQEHTPPFRDSSQTARFAAVLRALHVIPDDAFKHLKPRVYEIARTEAWDLSDPDDPTPAPAKQSTPPPLTLSVSPPPPTVSARPPPPTPNATPPTPTPASTSRVSPNKVHPDRVNQSRWWSGPLVGTGWLVLGLFVALWIVVIKMTPDEQQGEVMLTFPLIVPILLIFSFEMIAIIYTHAFGRHPDQEPFAFFEGISIWPTEGLRIFAFLLGLYFWFLASESSEKNRADVEDHFCLDSKVAGSRPAGWPGPEAASLWSTYLRHLSRWWTIPCVAFSVLLYLFFSWCIWLLFGGPPIPARGSYARNWDGVILWGTIILFLSLTFYVVYRILIVRRMIQYLDTGTTYWPQGARLKWTGWPYLDDSEIAELIDIHFIARRTGAIAPLIYYPFIIISVMILSRMPIFDHWDWSVGLVIILGINTLIATISAFLLRSAAEKARASSLERLEAALDQATLASHRDQLRAAIQEIRNVDTGAFAAISQQPIIRAIALQGGGVALLAAVRTFMM
jgi:hypothetical protein